MKRLVAVIVLAFWSIALIGPASAIGRVWCVGQDGHAAIEFAFGAACAESPASVTTKNDYAASVYGDHCGACTDSAFSVSASARQSAAAVTPPLAKYLPATLTPSSAKHVADEMGVRSIQFAATWNSSDSHLQRKSVVLRR